MKRIADINSECSVSLFHVWTVFSSAAATTATTAATTTTTTTTAAAAASDAG